MAELWEDFRAEDVPEDDRSFDPIPAGDYLMQVIESAIQPTKSGSGDQLVLTLEVIDGPYVNRRIWDRLNIRNQNADAQRIAQRALADLCLAIGFSVLRKTEDLHFKPFRARVTIRQDKTGQYGPQNSIRYKSNSWAPTARPTSAQPAVAPQNTKVSSASTAATTNASARPWANKQKTQRVDDDIPY